jgi:hypothetical protein
MAAILDADRVSFGGTNPVIRTGEFGYRPSVFGRPKSQAPDGCEVSHVASDEDQTVLERGSGDEYVRHEDAARAPEASRPFGDRAVDRQLGERLQEPPNARLLAPSASDELRSGDG